MLTWPMENSTTMKMRHFLESLMAMEAEKLPYLAINIMKIFSSKILNNKKKMSRSGYVSRS